MQNEVEIAIVLAVYGVLFLFLLGIQLLVCYFLYKPAKALPQNYRSQVSPGQAFLLLIPLFNIVWTFIYPKNLSQAYQRHMRSIGHAGMGDCGEQLAFYWALSSVLAIIPCLGALIGIGGLVCMIMYLVKINQCATFANSGYASMTQKPAGNFHPNPMDPNKDNPFKS